MGFLLRGILLILLLILLLPFIVHVKPVQNWAVDKIANKLSDKTGAEVQIGEVDFSISKGLVLESLFISDPDNTQDTLAYFGSLSTSLEENLTSILSNKLSLNDVTVDNAYLRINTKEDDSGSNLGNFLYKLAVHNEEKGPRGQPLDLNINSANFSNIHLVISEGLRHSKTFKVGEGQVLLNKLDLENRVFDISKLMLSNPTYIELRNEKSQTFTSEIENSMDTIEVANTQSLDLRIGYLEISNGGYMRDDWYKSKIAKKNSLDVDHLHLTEINLNADSTIVQLPLKLESEIKSLTLKEDNGFEIYELNVGSLEVDEQSLALNDFFLNTGKSKLGEDLQFQYDDFSSFKKFAQEIEIDADLRNSKISFADLNYFFPELENSSFSRKNRSKWIKLTGQVSGTIDDLEADQLSLSFNDLISFEGYLSTSDLTMSESALVNLHVEQLRTSLTNLSQIIPDFNPPAQFYKLDPITFSGDIDGYFKDFVLYGNLDSPLGQVTLDTRLDIKDGINTAGYSGELALTNFDMKTWTDNDDFGYATFTAEILDGRGLIIDEVHTDLSAELQSFDYKGYSYQGVKLEGAFEKNLFDGVFSSSDPNAQLEFDGQIHLVDNTINSDFKTKIQKIDLIALNLSKDISAINGDIDLEIKGSKTDDFVGSANIKNLQLNYKNKNFSFDSLLVSSSPEVNGARNIVISSDLVNGSLDGKFNFSDLGKAVKDHLVYAHPRWAKKFGIQKSQGIRNLQKFGYKLHITDTKDYLELANVNDLRLENLMVSGTIDSEGHKYESDVKVDLLTYKKTEFESLHLKIDELDKRGDHTMNLQKLVAGSNVFNPIEVITEMEDDRLIIRVLTKELLDSFQRVDLSLNVYPKKDKLIASLAENTLQMFSSTWEVNPGNKIIYGDEYIDLEKFIISDGNRNIVVDDINNRGIQATVQNFDFLTINGFIAYDKIKFAGEGDLNLSKVDLFEQSALSFDMNIEEFTLNDQDYGSLYVNALDDGEDKVSALVFLNKAEDGMNLDVGVDLNKKTKAINGTITAKNLPMKTFEMIIDDGISDTAGEADVYGGTISGTLDDIKLSAEAQVTGGTTTIDYLGAELYLGNEKFIVTDTMIDLTNSTITDKYGNVAVMTGGLYHKLFTDFTTDLKMESDYFLALDTEKNDNPSYYGQGIGDMTVNFSGPFSSTDITVDAVSGRGTVINIPVGETLEDYDESFIKEVKREEIFGVIKDTINLETPTLEGVDIRMNLVITEAAKINIIFNEATNDIMKGTGNGNMRVVVSRKGDFNIFGDYVIEAGEYLFTYFGGIVSKPFTVKRGGQIVWTGDPINANINLEANYEKLRSPLSVFLAEYLNAANAQEATRRTDVDLKMFLTGTLYKPTVDFDLEFPELQGELKTLSDSKMRILRDNEADLNEQVAGLIMFGSFLPSTTLGNQVGSASGLARTGYNTLSEMVSNQLSFLLSGFLQEALTENGFVSGIDFDVGFSKNSEFENLGVGSPDNGSIVPDEIEVHLKPRFQNDKWEIDYGTSYVNNATISPIPRYVIHDFVLGFYLTDDRRLKLKAYGKWDKDINANNGQKFGFGIDYKKEFGTLTDFKKALTEDIGKLKRQESN